MSDDRRRWSLKDFLQLGVLVLACAGVVWRGGQMTEKLENVATNVTQVQASIGEVKEQVGETRASAREMKIRVDGHDKELANHETRLIRVEVRADAAKQR